MGVIGRKEAFLRVLATVFLVLTVCLVAFDAQTKLLFYSVVRKATFRDLNALFALVWIDSAAAVCNLLLLFRSYILPGSKEDVTSNYKYLAWGFCLLDQVNQSRVVVSVDLNVDKVNVLKIRGSSTLLVLSWAQIYQLLVKLFNSCGLNRVFSYTTLCICAWGIISGELLSLGM
ncbi:unnamed protein product [Fraxinus pennsylvanica]|uniref:CASP-like protein n=1 Tax=Fraxinus pennsylvanica TaxID=56036 RepID=A0AAD2A4Q2_9LAMI|nr:unnamed protein product [Fraxinus pennsylvanica]